MKTVYLVSGPLGAGKTTITTKLVKEVDNAKLVRGDDLYNLSEQSDLSWEQKLTEAWKIIISMTKSYLKEGHNVVVDYVVEDELGDFCRQISKQGVTIK